MLHCSQGDGDNEEVEEEEEEEEIEEEDEVDDEDEEEEEEEEKSLVNVESRFASIVQGMNLSNLETGWCTYCFFP